MAGARTRSRHGLEWVHPEACYAHPLANGRGAVLYREPDRTSESLERLSTGAGDAWQEFAWPYVERFEALRETLLGSFLRSLAERGWRSASVPVVCSSSRDWR